MRHRVKQELSLALLLFVLGFFVVVQVRSVSKNRDIPDIELKRAEELQTLLMNERDKNERLTSEYEQMKSAYESLQSADVQTDARVQALEMRLEDVQRAAGLTDLRGPGVVVTMRSGSSANLGFEGEPYFKISESDVLQVVNNLRDAGAEAICLNDQRILAMSEIKISDNTISVNRVKTVEPYVIKAIGDPKSLEASLVVKGGVIDILKEWGIETSVVKSNLVKIKGYDGAASFKFAQAGE